ncbi:hypothetical protein [Marinobacter sp.]|uniref:hypothetical protein n=1 Tax=Marinobacter sp. TaxID=50741 RepID=UPI00384FB81E
MNQELFYRLHQHARKGGKVARRRQVKRVEAFVRWCGRAPAQIGRRQVHEFYRAHAFAPTTARDYDSAIRLLWRTLGRAGEPPRPPNAAGGGPTS